MRVLKNRFNTVEWNKWQGRNRELEIDNTIEKLAPPWAAENPDLNFSHRNGLHNDNDTSRQGIYGWKKWIDLLGEK